MKYLIISAFVIFTSCKKTEDTKVSTQKEPNTTKVEDLKPDLNKNYWHLEGKIGDIPVAMELTKQYSFNEAGGKDPNKTVFAGSYYYLSEEKPIEFMQKDSVFVNNKLNLSAHPNRDYNHEEIFSGTFDGLTFKGNWTANGKTITFELKETYADNQMKFKYFGKSENIPYKKNTATFKEELFASENNNLINDSIRKIMYNGKTGDFTTLLQNSYSDYAKSYQDDLQKFEKDFQEPSLTNNYSTSSVFTPIINTGKRLVFEYSFYGYIGGAHGNGGVINHNFDVNQNKFLAAADIFKSNRAQLNEMVNNAVHEKYKIPTSTPLTKSGREDVYFLVDKVPFTNNFILSKKGITFVYNVYEVMPYAAGPYEIFIPYEKMKNDLQPNFKY